MPIFARAWTATWKISLFLILWGLLYAPAVLVIDLDDRGQGAAIVPATRLQLEAFGAVAVVVAAWVAVRLFDRRRLRSLGFALPRALPDLVIGLALGSALIAIALTALWLPGWVERVPVGTFSWRMLAIMGAAILFNSVIQEVLVRGYALQTIESGFGVTPALIASSALFVLLHAGAIAEGGILPAVNLFAAGWLLGLAYTTSRNLWLPIGLHFAWNFLQGPVLGIAVTGEALDGGWEVVRLEGPTIFTGGAFGLEAGLAATLVTLLGIAALIAVARARGPRVTPPGSGPSAAP